MLRLSPLNYCLILTMALTSTTALAENPKPHKTINLQEMMVQQCANQALTLKMTDAASARKVCTCTIGVQAKQLSLGEFWAIQSATANGQNPENLAAIKRIQPALNMCYKGVTMRPPQFPKAAENTRK